MSADPASYLYSVAGDPPGVIHDKRDPAWTGRLDPRTGEFITLTAAHKPSAPTRNRAEGPAYALPVPLEHVGAKLHNRAQALAHEIAAGYQMAMPPPVRWWTPTRDANGWGPAAPESHAPFPSEIAFEARGMVRFDDPRTVWLNQAKLWNADDDTLRAVVAHEICHIVDIARLGVSACLADREGLEAHARSVAYTDMTIERMKTKRGYR